MRRIHFFEIHEQRWFPGFLRDQMTEGLQAIFDFADLYRPIAPLLRQALEDSGAPRVVDLCSGAGGPWPKLRETCPQEFSEVEVLLTDKYPNAKALERFGPGRPAGNGGLGGAIQVDRRPVDVLDTPRDLAGFRTMFTAFHHFTPEEARAILRDAAERRQGIAIFEIPKPSVRTALAVFLVPFAYLGLVPFLRPFRWSRLLWAYLLPVIPFVLWFDGMVSCMRAYTPRELKELAEGLPDGYRWEAGEKTGSGFMPATVTYLIGCPVARERSAEREHATASAGCNG
jgi:hypothetical protein